MVLDLGCGTLTNLQFLAGQKLRAYGLDASFIALQRGRSKVVHSRAAGHCLSALVGDVTCLPYRNHLARYVLDLGLPAYPGPAPADSVRGGIVPCPGPAGVFHLFCFQRVSPEEPQSDERRFFLPENWMHCSTIGLTSCRKTLMKNPRRVGLAYMATHAIAMKPGRCDTGLLLASVMPPFPIP